MPAALELVRIEKRFGATPVLRDVSLTVEPGEVHALVGENGAGKSTLVRIVCGAEAADRGEVRLSGARVRFSTPLDARRAGVATIHQELSLVGSMSVAENLALPRRGGWFDLTSHDADAQEAQARLDALGIDVAPEALVETLPVASQQLLEIAKALAGDAVLFVFDEPTSSLHDADAERLFREIDGLKARGKGVLFVSHRASDLARVADRITVLRDGEVALSKSYGETDEREIIAAMLGRAIDAPRAAARPMTRDSSESAPPRIRVSEVRVTDEVDPTRRSRALVRVASLDVLRGEIVGLAGLRGGGASELLAAIYGAARHLEGWIGIDGEAVVIGNPRDALASGVAFVPADRKHAALLPELDVLENASLASLPRQSPRGILSRRLELGALEPLLSRLGLERVDLAARLADLSGGTQQKVCLARALLTAPRVLLLDEPTRGVDIGAKSIIHAFLEEEAARGLAVLFASTDTEELFALAHRIVVFRDGEVVLDAPRTDVAREALTSASMGAATP